MKEKINKLYSMDLNKRIVFDREDLYNLELGEKDIYELITLGLISNITDDVYTFKYEKLYEYGLKYMKEENYTLATKCLLRQYHIHNDKELLKMLFYCIKKENSIIDILKYYYDKVNDKISLDCYDLCIIKLLDDITELPKEYKEIITDEKTIKEIENKTKDTKKVQLMISILNNNYKLTNEILKEIPSCFNIEMIKYIIHIKIGRKYKLKNMIINKKYSDVLEYLKSVKTEDKECIYIIKLINILEQIELTQTIPQKTSLNSKNIFEAIDNNDFDKALKFARKETTLQILLEDITKKINDLSIKKTRKAIDRLKIARDLYNKISLKLNKGIITHEVYQLIDEYLEYFKSKKYRFIVDELIKVCELKKDYRYSEVKMFLSRKMERNNPTVHLKPFVTQYKNSINYENKEISKTYLNIINEIIKIANLDIKVKVTNKKEKILLKKKKI